MEKEKSFYFVSNKWKEELEDWGGTIICISGASGSGKSTLANSLKYPIVPFVTTRALRDNETGVTQLSDIEFAQFNKKRKFATIVSYSNRSYGILLNEFRNLSKQHQVLILVLCPTIYKRIAALYKNVIGVYVEADEKTIIKRLKERDKQLEKSRVASIKNNRKFRKIYNINVKNSSFLWWSKFKLKWKLRSHLQKEVI